MAHSAVETHLEGSWGNTTWQFFLSSELPSPELCTAVGIVAIRRMIPVEEVVLTLTERGRGEDTPPRFELAAGHIDPINPDNPNSPKESPEAAAVREVDEEIGLDVDEARVVLFGYRRIINPPGSKYPELSFMPYYYYRITNDESLGDPTDPCAAGSFSVWSMEELVEVGMMPKVDLEIAKFGLMAARRDLEGAPNAI